MTFYERLETLRKERGISQGALEKTLGFSNGSISKCKHSMPTHKRLQKLADFFHVSIDYLVTGENPEPVHSLPSDTAMIARQIYEEDNILFEVYCSADKERLIEYAKKLKELRELEN